MGRLLAGSWGTTQGEYAYFAGVTKSTRSGAVQIHAGRVVLQASGFITLQKEKTLEIQPQSISWGSLVSLSKLRKLNSLTNTAELIHVLRPSCFCYRLKDHTNSMIYKGLRISHLLQITNKKKE